MSPPTLRRALAATGCKAPAARQEWRVGEEEVGAALRWREARPPLATHAAARGLSAKVLARRMGVVGGWRGRRWTAAEVIAVLEAGPVRREPGPPTPEEILEAGERLAGMVALVWPADPFARENAIHVARMAAGHLRRRADASRSPC